MLLAPAPVASSGEAPAFDYVAVMLQSFDYLITGGFIDTVKEAYSFDHHLPPCLSLLSHSAISERQ